MEESTGDLIHEAVKDRNHLHLISLLDSGGDVEARDVNGKTPLHVAAETKYTLGIETLLKRGANINQRDNFSKTPICYAVNCEENICNKSSEVPLRKRIKVDNVSDHSSPHLIASQTSTLCVQLLLEGGANVNVRDNKHNTPLYYAIKSGNYEIVEMLVHKGARSELISDPSPKHICKRYDIVGTELLLDSGASVNMIDGCCNPLLHAVRNCNVKFMKYLISKGANLEVKDRWNLTSLQILCNMNFLSGSRLLVESGANVNVSDKCYATPLHIAARNRSCKIMKLLIDKGADLEATDYHNSTPLLIACEGNNFMSFKFLVDAGASVNVRDSELNTPLHRAASNINCRIMKLLIDKGANVNAENNRHSTPLHIVCKENTLYWKVKLLLDAGINLNVNAVCNAVLLVDAGAKVNVRDSVHNTPLHYAAKCGKNKIIKFLLERGADLEVLDSCNSTPLIIVCEKNNLVGCQILIDAGANVNVSNCENNTPLHKAANCDNNDIIKILIDRGADLEVVDSQNATPLHIACKRGNLVGSQLLVDAGASVNVSDSGHSTPLHYAAAVHDSCKIMKSLIDRGADLDAADNQSLTPLYIACINNNILGSQLLLDVGCNVILKDAEGNTPLHKAVSFSLCGIVEKLLIAGASVFTKNNFGEIPLGFANKEILRGLECYNLMIKHLTSLNAANLYKNISIDFSPYIDVCFQNKCFNEVEKMKKKRFHRVSLYNVLRLGDSSDPLLPANKVLEETLTSLNLDNEFPIYSSQLRFKFLKGKKRYELLNNALQIFDSNFFCIQLPSEIKRKILSYLSNKDLKIIITPVPIEENAVNFNK